MKDKQITYANEDGLFRLRAVEMVQKGETFYSVAKKIGVHQTTVSEWVKMYNKGGIDRLNTYRKPRPNHSLNIEELNSILSSCDEKYHKRIKRLLRVAHGEQLKVIALDEKVSVQSIMKDRRLFDAGKLPPVVVL